MLSDGFADQLGGTERKMFGMKRLYNLLNYCHGKPFKEQESIIIKAYNDYKGEDRRVDDVTVVGFELDYS